MKAGDLVLARIPQADAQFKLRPALVLCLLPPFGDLLDRSFGHESYTRAVLRLLEQYGPFRLAFFESMFRAADIRASIKAK